MDEVAHSLLVGFLLFLPAGTANMSPVFASRIPGLKHWNTPVDLGRSWHGKRLLGNNKTWRGIAFGTFIGSLTAVIEISLFTGFQPEIKEIIAFAFLGALLGFGALLGDMVESFFKRRANLKPGETWFPFDQVDYIIGGLLLSYPLVRPDLPIIISIFVVYFILHLLFSYIGFLLGFKDKPI